MRMLTTFSRVTKGFGYAYLFDNSVFLLFYFDNPIMKEEVMSYFKNYKMKIVNEWTIINFLHLGNPLHPTKKILNFFCFPLQYLRSNKLCSCIFILVDAY